MKFSVFIERKPLRNLAKIPKPFASEIKKKILNLRLDPFPQGHIKLQGNKDTYRIRYSVYRVIYNVDTRRKTIFIVKIVHRKDAY